MPDQDHCPKCGTEPWNGSDGAGGVCPDCLEAGESSEEAVESDPPFDDIPQY